jgi:hypothetical protein
MKTLLAGMALSALCTSIAIAQTAPDLAVPTETIRTTAGPSSSVTTTRRTLDGRGGETDAKETDDKSQSYTSGNGELSATTRSEITEQSKVSAPPAVVTKSTTTTTTTDETSH